ncbi:MAG TPA: nucleoside-triphosphatase [Bacteroidales bacterium]|nr:nucleoside-triphosphatase [Bacteroidales bacterium]
MTISEVTISEKWIKASIIGTIWAAAEIVLGSFLHNLRVPFSGNILTAIGLVILISVSHIWREKGLFWRAGLICAMMKTLSPSAIIFGPMIAIISESLLLEAAVRLFGRTIFAFVIGSMLAMSWNLFQKIFNLIIFYGNNIVDLYSNLSGYAARELNLKFDSFWAPLIILLVLYALFGAATSVVGIKTGRKIASQPLVAAEPESRGTPPSGPRPGKAFSYSITWLVADIILIAGLLMVVSYATWIYWTITVIPVITIFSVRYKRAMRKLSKPRFWILFVIITMLSALAFTVFQSGGNSLADGLLIGIQMNFRAVIIVVGFSALGTELYNPKIRSLFKRTHLKQLPLALELSAASLPTMIAEMPDFRTVIKDPASILSRMIARVERRLSEARASQGRTKQLFILTGAIGEGKTIFLQKLTELLKTKGVMVGGIMAPRTTNGDTTTGYDIIDLGSGKREPFMKHIMTEEKKGVDRFTICEEGLQAGLDALDPDRNRDKRLIIIDEAGPLELRGCGWAGRISELLYSNDQCLLIVVRKSLVEEVIRKWNLKECKVISVSDPFKAESVILEYLFSN